MTIQLSRYIGGLFSYYTQIWEGIFTPFQRDFSKSPIWPQAGGEKILLLYGGFFAVFICICRNFFAILKSFFAVEEKGLLLYGQKMAFCGGVFKNVYKIFKNTPLPERVSLLYAGRIALFTAISRKIFHFSLLCLPSGKRSSYYTQKKRAFCEGVF